eukprot:TRINITY_DN10106_c0_g1_i1.p1 TRINITY_DN10106_c0_g1~~TRINITY_DN10106_c0_g1_i1.p1  ORF type:complete len:594 (+),score=138.08 TRINITY_DN10106_c0_g1_i1:316-2097(+)
MISRARLLIAGTGAAVASVFAYKNDTADRDKVKRGPLLKLPDRKHTLEALDTEHYDIVVVGGGATGCGVALDAVTRGLKVALIERDDYASGTSSRSTKLIHGGVRYLEKAVKNLDKEQYALVVEALRERENLLKIAPHVANELAILVPLYKWWEVPYLFAGLKLYDILAWYHRRPSDPGVSGAYVMGRTQTLAAFPQLIPDGLKAGIVYYDGQHDDAAMTLMVALTAAEKGAALANHVEVTELLKNEEGKVNGVRARDTETGKVISISATAVVNATGCFTDKVLDYDAKQEDEPSSLVVPSQGLHVILPQHFTPTNMGLLEPSTSDGRVLFLLPWLGRVVAGTTDAPTEITDRPAPRQDDVDFVIEELNKKLSTDLELTRKSVRSAWTGIRPLVKHPDRAGTADIPRTHFVYVSESGLVTIAGGKWTTYRQMAEDTLDEAIKAHPALKPPKPSSTSNTMLLGGDGYARTLPHVLVQKYRVEFELASHLAARYGDRAFDVIEMSDPHKPLVAGFPYLQGEVVYSCRHEQARTIVDVLARRTRLAFLDYEASKRAVPTIAELMTKELQWDAATAKAQTEDALAFLETMRMPEAQS